MRCRGRSKSHPDPAARRIGPLACPGPLRMPLKKPHSQEWLCHKTDGVPQDGGPPGGPAANRTGPLACPGPLRIPAEKITQPGMAVPQNEWACGKMGGRRVDVAHKKVQTVLLVVSATVCRGSSSSAAPTLPADWTRLVRSSLA